MSSEPPPPPRAVPGLARCSLRIRRLGACLAGICLTSCGAVDPGPRWIELARGYRPAPLLPLAQGWHSQAGLDPAEVHAQPDSVRVLHPVPRSAWTRNGDAGDWSMEVPEGACTRTGPRFLVLRSETHPIAQVAEGHELTVDTFRARDGRLDMRLAAGILPPEDLFLTARLETGRLASDEVWQVRIGNDYGAGLPVWSGLSVQVVSVVPGDSRLSFHLRYLSCSRGPVRLRVRLDGDLVHERTEDASQLAGPGRWVSFALPPAARQEARFSFEVEGPPGQALLMRPILGPAEIGSVPARPWSAQRPDIVLFLVDTLRADTLAAFGGAPEIAPALNRFAAQSLRFQSAHSNAAWTLPSIGTLLTGLAPGQHTANESGRALPPELVTVVESLARSGYRTGAVTDAAFFTPTYGLDQGFETFRMNPPAAWDLDWSVDRAREFLAQDDGRPAFLVVHTYRTHMPYRVGAEEDLQPWRELLASGCALLQLRSEASREDWQERLAGCKDRLRALYLEGVRDLDRGFEALVQELERSGHAERGFVIVCSDHGEALGENQDVFHDGPLWESKLRIPLLVRGPGLAPRDVTTSVTLLDLTPTLAAIAGLPRDPLWLGESILTVSGPRPAGAYLLKKKSQIALIEGDRKLLFGGIEALERGIPESAFDLARDPWEDQPLAGEDWAPELARRHLDFLRASLVPAGEAVRAALDQAQRRELDGLGYAGGEEHEQGRE